MSKTYKNTSDRAILGIEPGQTGDLDDAAGYVGPGALEEEGESERFFLNLKHPKTGKGPTAAAEAIADADGD